MDIVVTGRHTEVSDRFREYVEEKLTKLEKFDGKVFRVAVQVRKLANGKNASRPERVEMTVYSKGPVVRAEAEAHDMFAAMDLALDKLMARMRKAADRRRVHQGRRRPRSVAEATADNGALLGGEPTGDVAVVEAPAEKSAAEAEVDGVEQIGDGPIVVRRKVHDAAPMTLDQALYEMELVGHDFYLFVDAETSSPSVVYRRRGYDYGVIRLQE